jgi:vacuolar protein sorting-associated protein 13A/C
MKILDAVERAITSRLHAKESLLSRATSQKASYMQKLSTKILDNLEVVITNVHLRYEDNQSIPNTVFAGGITIDGLTLMTTDERWSSAFISRKTSDSASSSSSSSCIHKLGTVNGLGVYWNTHSSSSDDLSPNQWDVQMMNATKDSQQKETTAASTSIDTVSILQPMNKCSLRIKHQAVAAAASATAACTDNSPTIDMTIDSTDLHLQLSDLQYRQMLTALQYFRVLDTRRLLVSHRPTNRPTADPRAWWHYAYKLLTGRENVGNNNKVCLSVCSSEEYLSIYLSIYLV